MDIDKFESGKFTINPNAGLLLANILLSSVRNKVFLNHLIGELYQTDEETQKVLAKLKEDAVKEFYELYADIVVASERDRQNPPS